jgi:hypothetical protein
MKVFILGMHRSGTSMIAGVLDRCGLNLGDVHREGDEGNPKGYFEDRRFIEINESILARNRGAWDAPPQELQFDDGLRETMDQFLGQWDHGQVVCLKDPRTCLTLPLWREALGSEPARAILVVRPVRAIAESLEARWGLPFERGWKLAERYIHAALAHLYRLDIPFISASYPRFLMGWREEMRRVLGFIGAPLPAETGPVERFIDAGLCHHGRPS